MELVSMELEKSQADEMYGSPVQAASPDETPKYPYGLQLRLDEEGLKKLGMKDLPKVGTDMKLIAEVEVVSVSQSETKEGSPDQCVCLQIEMMSLEPMADDPSEKSSNPAATLYGSGS